MKEVGFPNERLLLYYSLFAASYLRLNTEASGQVVYHDVNPDIVLDSTGEFALLDIDSNSTIDFEFLNSSFTFYSASFGSYLLRKDLLVGPYVSQNGLVGISNHYSFGYFDVYRFFPSALSLSANILESLSWQTNATQIMALVTLIHDFEDTFRCDICDWYGFYQMEDVLDHYLGIRFIDTYNKNHYGWIRCDVTDLGRRLVIKDYAYESVPDYPILAGSHESYAIIKSSKPLLANAFGGGNEIHINVIQRPEEDYLVKVFNISGQLIFESEFNETFISIPFEQPADTYIVSIICGIQKVAKEIVIVN